MQSMNDRWMAVNMVIKKNMHEAPLATELVLMVLPYAKEPYIEWSIQHVFD